MKFRNKMVVSGLVSALFLTAGAAEGCDSSDRKKYGPGQHTTVCFDTRTGKETKCPTNPPAKTTKPKVKPTKTAGGTR